MTRKETIDEAQEIENEISHLKDFMKMLECELTMHDVTRPSKTFVQKETKFNFLGIWKGGICKDINIRIPDKMIIEINVLCITWLEELEKRADDLLNRN